MGGETPGFTTQDPQADSSGALARVSRRAVRVTSPTGTGPVSRQASVDQREKPDRTEPMLTTDPADSTQASEPAEPIDRIEPAEPTDKMEPVDPMDRIDPLEPMDRIDPDEPAERDELLLLLMGVILP